MSWANNSGLELNFAVLQVREALEKNRITHEKIFKEAEDGYKRKLKQELENKLGELVLGKLPQSNSSLVRPTNNLEEYDAAIEMLKLTTDATIKLTQEQFNCYMRDKWSWKSSFLTTNSLYSSTAANSIGASYQE